MKDHRLLQLVGISSVRYMGNGSSAVNGSDIQLTKSIVWYRLFRDDGYAVQPWQDRLDDYRQDK